MIPNRIAATAFLVVATTAWAATAAWAATPAVSRSPAGPRPVGDAASVLSLVADPRVLWEIYSDVAHRGLHPAGIVVEPAGEHQARFTVQLRSHTQPLADGRPCASFTVLVGSDAAGHGAVLDVGRTIRDRPEESRDSNSDALDAGTRREIRKLVGAYWQTHRSFQEARPRLRATGRAGALVFLTLTRLRTEGGPALSTESLIVDVRGGKVFCDSGKDAFGYAPSAGEEASTGGR